MLISSVYPVSAGRMRHRIRTILPWNFVENCLVIRGLCEYPVLRCSVQGFVWCWLHVTAHFTNILSLLICLLFVADNLQ